MSPIRTAQQVRADFEAARQRGLRAKEAAEHIGLTEGAALAAYAATQMPVLKAIPVKAPLTVYALKPRWLDILQSLQVCGPVLALTRNESTVHEKTGVYEKVSGNQTMGLVLGPDIDLRLLFDRWAGGLLVLEPGGASDTHARSSLQFFDRRGVAVHKVFPVASTDRDAWNQMASAWVDTSQTVAFDPTLAPLARRGGHVRDPEALIADWAAMTDTHQFVGLLNDHEVERLPALHAAAGHFARRVGNSAVRLALYQASFSGLSIMVFVGSTGCIQIHTGPVSRIEPMNIHGKEWLNVLDPGFNLHLREDLIAACWVVQKPTDDGIVTSLEVFDAQGELMALLFGQRKPGQPEQQGWTDLLADIHTHDIHDHDMHDHDMHTHDTPDSRNATAS
jgi:putative hemin transport protein